MNASEPIADIGKQALVELINRSFSAVDAVVAFTKEQLPDVIYQLLLWKAVQSFLWFVFCVAVIVVSCIITKKHAKSTNGFSWFPCGVASFLSLIILAKAGMDWLQIWLAPKLYLLEYASQLVK